MDESKLVYVYQIHVLLIGDHRAMCEGSIGRLPLRVLLMYFMLTKVMGWLSLAPDVYIQNSTSIVIR